MKKVSTICTDDIDGSADAETHRLSIDGYAIDIDLSPANRGKLYAALRPYLDAGRRVTGVGSRRRPPDDIVIPPVAAPSEIRAWWKAHQKGLPTYQARGAIPAAVVRTWQTQRGVDT